MQLREAIALRLVIDHEYQELFFSDGKSLWEYFSSDCLVQIGLKHRDTITVVSDFYINFLQPRRFSLGKCRFCFFLLVTWSKK